MSTPSKRPLLKSPVAIIVVIAGLLIAFYLVYYQIPGTTTLSGAAGAPDSTGAKYIVLYQHAYYGGWSYFAPVGEYPNLQYWDASSISIANGTSALIYSGSGFTGNVYCVQGDIGFLGSIAGYNWNDSIRSMIVYNQTGCQ